MSKKLIRIFAPNRKTRITFTVTGSTTLDAYIYRDYRPNLDELRICFKPDITPPPDGKPHEVSDSKLREEARPVALRLASEYLGMPESDLVASQVEGVGVVVVIPVKGKSFPVHKDVSRSN